MVGIAVEVQDGPVVQTLKFIRAYWLLLLPAALLCRFVYYRYASPLRQYPGPWLASGSRAWKVWSTYNGKSETDHIELHERYGLHLQGFRSCIPLMMIIPGPIVRIAPNELSFSSPYAAREVLAAGKGFHKTNFYRVFPPAENPDIFTETNERAHGLKKRYASNAYSMAAMQGLGEYIEDTQRLLVNRLDQKCKSPEQTCDLGDWLVSFLILNNSLGQEGSSNDSLSIALLRIRCTG